ncbi:MAG: DUF1887 family protein [Clostridia bacterium]|nr:DUF1887 family protein [Clostridia bacterium]
MASCLAIKPDKIIFIGEKKPMKKQESVYLRFANAHGVDVEFGFKPINKNSVEQIVSALTEIVETEENCAFDLTGGEDLVLVAMGIVFEKYRSTGKIQMHRFNVRTGTVYDCDSDGVLPDTEPPKLTVKDNIMLYGGTVVSYNGNKGTYEWVFDDDFESDLKTMWDICKKNPGLWNSQIGTFSCISETCTKAMSQLEVSANKAHIEEVMNSQKHKYVWVSGLVKNFCRYGLIENLADDDDTVSFAFKNEQVKLCLTKEGTLLELMVLLHAKAAKEKDGSARYDDAVNGVYIDWDSTIHDISEEEKDTENEIDVVLTKGLVPVFISCKNGYVDETELYKLNTVSEKFGGPYAQKVLVASYFGKNSIEGHKYFVQRAKDMKIQLIENVHELSEEEFAKKIKNILC